MLRRVGVRGCATQTRRGTRSQLRRAHAELIDWRRSAGLLEANCAGEGARSAVQVTCAYVQRAGACSWDARA